MHLLRVRVEAAVTIQPHWCFALDVVGADQLSILLIYFLFLRKNYAEILSSSNYEVSPSHICTLIYPLLDRGIQHDSPGA